MTRSLTGRLTGRLGKWLVLVVWLVLAAIGGSFAGQLTDVEENDTVEWLPGNAESTAAFKEQGTFASTEAVPAVIVYVRDGGVTEADMAKAAADAEAFRTFENLDGEVLGPIPSEDGEAIQLIVPVDIEDDWELAPDLLDEVRERVTSDAGDLQVEIAGPLAMVADQAESFGDLDSSLLLAAVSVVIVILLLTYRSPILWILPLICAGVAVTCAQGVVYLLARYADLTVNAQSASILAVLVLAASIDYALLLVARYREELRRHEDRHEAMDFALHRAGPAVMASAGTVVLGMLCLIVAEMNSTAGMGPVLAVGVAVGMSAMLTLFPAVLVIFGRWVFWPKRPHFGSDEPTTRGLWAKMGNAIRPRPRMVWVTTTVILGAMTLGITQLNANGLSLEEGFTSEPDFAQAERVLAEHFDVGAGDPVTVIANADQIDAVSAALRDHPAIGSVTEPRVVDDRAYIEGTLTLQPYSDEAGDAIDEIRSSVHGIDGSDAVVGGSAAINVDMQEASARDNLVVIPLVLVVVLLILIALLRSLVAPLVLIGTVILSFGAALGVSGFVFENVFGFAGTDSSFPLFAFVFLVALGIDYNIFLMTRVREEAASVGTRRGALIGLAATGGVITSAGLVLAGTFSVFLTMPLVFLAEIGFVVAFGVLLDTLIVRAVLVTALNLDIGRFMWWPSRLAKVPDVDEAGPPPTERTLTGAPS
ncbi:MMPL family transporter [Phytoactinopolyspora halotolerans]|uniref:MMPL family transporter n=1 Tax=Phytoactinopolyspora halotolerans TaxID=1981512 RepID=A0A6L9S6I4_9ACTN|nr:MMPL family transporter [Phytoactinopolyspora halotolerans]NEE00689.1 MMPL family transporter [Phytoactinopolyspora halotolerans]